MDARIVNDRQVKIINLIGEAVQLAIGKLAFDIEAKAKENITIVDAIDTGACRNSIHTVLPNKDGYIDAELAARSAAASAGVHSGRPNTSFKMFNKISPEKEGAVVAVGAEYGVHIEYGRQGNARPFFGPAIDTVIHNAPSRVVQEVNNKI